MFEFRIHQIVQMEAKVAVMKLKKRRNPNSARHHFFENVKKRKKLPPLQLVKTNEIRTK